MSSRAVLFALEYLLFLLAAPGSIAQELPVEHPLIRPFPGSELSGEPRVEAMGEMTLSYREAGERVRKKVSGAYRYLEYEIPESSKRSADETRAAILEHFAELAKREGGTIHSEEENRLIFSLPESSGGTAWCRLWASSEGYSLEIVDEGAVQPVGHPTDAEKTLSGGGDILREALERDGRVAAGITFVRGKPAFRPGSGAVLDEIALLLESSPNLRIEIYARAEESTSAGDLARERAQAVADGVALYGIDPSRLLPKGKISDLAESLPDEPSSDVWLVLAK